MIRRESEDVRWPNSLMPFIASVFSGNYRLWAARILKLEYHDWGNSNLLSVVVEIVKEQLYQLNVHKLLGPDKIHPRMLKELADIIA